MSLVPQSFCARPAVTVARALLGKRLRCGEVTVEITEVEAYAGPHDTACHAKAGWSFAS